MPNQENGEVPHTYCILGFLNEFILKSRGELLLSLHKRGYIHNFTDKSVGSFYLTCTFHIKKKKIQY